MKNIYPRTCKVCSSSFMGGPRAWYCPECRQERKIVQKREQERRAREGKTRKIGSVSVCLNCGQGYFCKSGTQKYCSKCAPQMTKALDRQQGLEYYNKNKSSINPRRNEKRRAENYCRNCGKPIDAVGGKQLCKDCKKEFYTDQREARNIKRRGSSYIVKVFVNGKSVFLKSTTDRELAYRLRNLAESKIKQGQGCFEKWFADFKSAGRNIDQI